MPNFDFIIVFVKVKGEILMNEELTWTKTILSAYRYLDRICGAIDKICLQSSLNSKNITRQNYHTNNVYAVTQKIIDLSQRKITLINLKVLIESCLSEIGKESAIILIETYFDGLKKREIAEKKRLSLRTVFRKIENAEQKFCRKLIFKGYEHKVLQEFLKSETWIINLHDQIANKSNVDDLVLSNAFLSRAVSM